METRKLASPRISRDIFWLGISFHDLHYSHEKVCLLMTAVYVRSTSICTTTYLLNSDLCGQKFSQKDRDLLLCKKDFHHHCCRRVMSSQKGLIFCARLVLWPQKGKQDVNRGISRISHRYSNMNSLLSYYLQLDNIQNSSDSP